MSAKSLLQQTRRIKDGLKAAQLLDAATGVWVDMRSNVARIDRFKKYGLERGIEQQFDTVKEAADWVDNRIKDSATR